MLTHPADARTLLYHFFKRSAILLALAFALKYAACDTVAVHSDQMAPTVQSGDRVLISRTAAAIPFRSFLHYARNAPVIFVQPNHPRSLGCLRIAGLPGDSVRIEDAMLLAAGIRGEAFSLSGNIPADEVLPADFSPRDNMPPFRVPEPGDTVHLLNLAVRDFVYLYAMVLQENPPSDYSLHPILTIGDSSRADYLIRDFYAYTGKFSDIPDTLRTSWFFWDRLRQYISQVEEGTPVDVSFVLKQSGMPIDAYVVKHRFYFLMSDSWTEGFDSRYFGPVSEDLIRGQVRATIWSIDRSKTGMDAMRFRRIARLTS